MRRFKNRSKARMIFISWISLLLIIFLIFILIDYNIRPLVKAIAENRAQIETAKVINQVIRDELNLDSIEYDDLANIERNNSGEIVAISIDSKKSNLIKSKISSKIQENFPDTMPKEVPIPIGTFTQTELLSAKGPTVNLKISLPGTVTTNFKSSFESAGINQTRHQIYLTINAKVTALIPGYPTTTAVETSVMIAETVIVGAVPGVYASLAQENAGDIASLSQLN